jgi:hypothetical protein
MRSVIVTEGGSFWAFVTFLKTRKVVFGSVTVGKNYINYPVKDGLNKVHLASMYKDNKRSLWLGTSDNGVFKFNGKSFERFKI